MAVRLSPFLLQWGYLHCYSIPKALGRNYKCVKAPACWRMEAGVSNTPYLHSLQISLYPNFQPNILQPPSCFARYFFASLSSFPPDTTACVPSLLFGAQMLHTGMTFRHLNGTNGRGVMMMDARSVSHQRPDTDVSDKDAISEVCLRCVKFLSASRT